MRQFNAEREMLYREIHSLSPKELKLILDATEKERPQEKNFSKIYSAEEIANDARKIAALEETWARSLSEYSPEERRKNEVNIQTSNALEATIVHMGELSNWFGQNAYVFRTTKTDDVLNGVDAVVEIEPDENDDQSEPQRFALAIDASTAGDPNVIEKKIYRNLEKIMGTYKKPAEVKYFESQITFDKEGESSQLRLDHVIPVVVGVEIKNATSLMSLYAEILQLKNFPKKSPQQKEDLKRKLSEAAKHPAQIVFLEQISAQLTMYETVLVDLKPEHQKPKLLNEVQKLQKFIDELKQTKNNLRLDNALHNDGVYIKVSSTCSKLMQSSIDKKE